MTENNFVQPSSGDEAIELYMVLRLCLCMHICNAHVTSSHSSVIIACVNWFAIHGARCMYSHVVVGGQSQIPNYTYIIGERYRLNVVKLHHHYNQLTRNVRLSHRRIATFSAQWTES